MNLIQLQYLINKYFIIIFLFFIFLLFLNYLILKKNLNIKYFFIGYIYLFFGILSVLFGKTFITIYENGWDRTAICNWIDISNQFNSLSVYSVQNINNLDKLANSVPDFSFYYHPSLLFKFQSYCLLSPVSFNLISLFVLIFVIVFLNFKLENISFVNILVLIGISFNSIYWLVNSGQFFHLEILTFSAGIFFISIKNYKSAIIFLFLFGIQKIYFLILPLYLSIKYFKLRGFYSFIALVTLINLIPIKIMKDYIYFWFSPNGYLTDKREGFHSFFDESFSVYNTSLMSLLKKVLNTFGLEINNTYLLIFYILFISLIYLIFSNYIKNVSNENKDYINFLFFILTYPLLKPYVYIYFSITLIFIINNFKNKLLEHFLSVFTAVGTFTWLILEPYFFTNRLEINILLNIQYLILFSSSFLISWFTFLFILKKIKPNYVKLDI